MRLVPVDDDVSGGLSPSLYRVWVWVLPFSQRRAIGLDLGRGASARRRSCSPRGEGTGRVATRCRAAKRDAAVLGVHGRVSYQRGRATGDPELPGERGRRRLGSDGDPSQKGMAVVCGRRMAGDYGQSGQCCRGRHCAIRTNLPAAEPGLVSAMRAQDLLDSCRVPDSGRFRPQRGASLGQQPALVRGRASGRSGRQPAPPLGADLLGQRLRRTIYCPAWQPVEPGQIALEQRDLDARPRCSGRPPAAAARPLRSGYAVPSTSSGGSRWKMPASSARVRSLGTVIPISRCETATREIAARSASSCWVQPSRQRSRAMRWPSVSPAGLSSVRHRRTAGPARRALAAAPGPRPPSAAPASGSRSTAASPAASRALRRVADQQIDLGRPHEALVQHDVIAASPARRGRRRSRQNSRTVWVSPVARRSRPARSCWSISHMRAHVVRRPAPVALRRRGCPARSSRSSPSLIRATPSVILRVDELQAAARRLVVEQDAGDGVQAVALAVVDGDPVAVHLRHAVRAARVERRRLALRHLADLAEHLATTTPGRSGCPGRRCGWRPAGGSRRAP